MPEARSTRIAVVGSNLPRRCGIATYSADLMAAAKSADPGIVELVAAIDEPNVVHSYGGEVHWRIKQGDARSYKVVAKAINDSGVDLVSVQHEFGLYGNWKDDVYEDNLGPFLEALRRPVITTLHSVQPRPKASMRDAMRSIARLSDEIVVMAETALDLLRNVYRIDVVAKVIPHGVPAVAIEPFRRTRMKEKLGLTGRTILSTFGLVDPRKGLEYVIEAMPAILADHPGALYVIAGQTHPEQQRKAGEQYRDRLISAVDRLGLQGQVSFLNEYMTQRDIIELLVATDVYVTPYLDQQQITSGTLAYALGAGKAIVSTPYLHAVEALAEGRGVLVDFRDPGQLEEAVNSILDDPVLKKRLERGAYDYAKDMAWPRAGERWLEIVREVLARSAAEALVGGGQGSLRT
jgi:glycosyltransferase involved in cell wall biosynthesis